MDDLKLPDLSKIDLSLGVQLPGEALVVASLNFAGKCLDYAAIERQTMDKSLLAIKDGIAIKAMQRADNLLEKLDGILNDALDDAIAAFKKLKGTAKV